MDDGRIGCEDLFVIPTGDPGRLVVYSPLRRVAFLANAAAVDLIFDILHGSATPDADPDGAVEGLMRALGLFEAPSEPEKEARAGPPAPTHVTLFLTTQCNLRCTYCYAMAGDRPVRHMPLHVARRGIDFVAENAKRSGAKGFEVGFHGGGEPTVAWTTLTGAVDHARRQAEALGLGVSCSTATNGYMPRSKARWIAGNLDSASVSFDGLPGAHDRHRPTAGGKGSSARIVKVLEQFDAAGFSYGLRLTVTADQIPDLVAGVDFILDRFNPARIQVEPAYALGRWREAPSAETDAFIDAFRQARRRAADLGVELTFSGARLDTLTHHFCGITRDAFALTPSGDVSACFEAFDESVPRAETFIYGRPDGAGFRFDLAALGHLRRQTVDHKPYCRDCFAKWHCAGDCHYRALEAGDGVFAGSDRCHIIQALTLDQILERIAASGGAVWAEARDGGAVR